MPEHDQLGESAASMQTKKYVEAVHVCLVQPYTLQDKVSIRAHPSDSTSAIFALHPRIGEASSKPPGSAVPESPKTATREKNTELSSAADQKQYKIPQTKRRFGRAPTILYGPPKDTAFQSMKQVSRFFAFARQLQLSHLGETFVRTTATLNTFCVPGTHASFAENPRQESTLYSVLYAVHSGVLKARDHGTTPEPPLTAGASNHGLWSPTGPKRCEVRLGVSIEDHRPITVEMVFDMSGGAEGRVRPEVIGMHYATALHTTAVSVVSPYGVGGSGHNAARLHMQHLESVPPDVPAAALARSVLRDAVWWDTDTQAVAWNMKALKGHGITVLDAEINTLVAEFTPHFPVPNFVSIECYKVTGSAAKKSEYTVVVRHRELETRTRYRPSARVGSLPSAETCKVCGLLYTTQRCNLCSSDAVTEQALNPISGPTDNFWGARNAADVVQSESAFWRHPHGDSCLLQHSARSDNPAFATLCALPLADTTAFVNEVEAVLSCAVHLTCAPHLQWYSKP